MTVRQRLPSPANALDGRNRPRHWVDELSLEEYCDLVTEITRWVDRHSPVGLRVFDAGWATIRAERAHRTPEECTLTRMLVSNFLAQLVDLRDDQPTRTA